MGWVTMVKDRILLTFSDLARNFDQAIGCIESDNGADNVSDLAAILHFVGLAKDNSFCLLAADAIGGLSSVINQFYMLVSTPYPLTKERQKAFEKMYNTAKKDCIASLKTLKIEFCEKDEPDYKILMISLGSINKHAGILGSRYGNLIRSARGSPTLPMPPPLE